MNYLARKTSIPVSRVLHLNLVAGHPLGIPGVKLATIFLSLTGSEQEDLLFRHRFDAIGNDFHVRPIVRLPFYIDGRNKLQLDRGSFSTAREYFLACTQRELCARTQSTQNTSDNYQRDVEDARFTVERSMMLLSNAIRGCNGLDDDNPELQPFSLSLADLDLSKIYVSPRSHLTSYNSHPD
ncbi:hypothetical protein JB92DRAFT_3085199 [Gautieria morchelliformis]|nr:hypothetical protein JB92DRAFT_3085199 [Gautieria morchelliformis]